MLVVGWFQWLRFMEGCGVDTAQRYNSSRLRSDPVRVNYGPDGKGCWMFSDNASVAVLNATFVAPAFECIYYFSEHGAYT